MQELTELPQENRGVSWDNITMGYLTAHLGEVFLYVLQISEVDADLAGADIMKSVNMT